MDEKEKNLTPTASPTPETTQPPVETSPVTAPEALQGQVQAQAPQEGGEKVEVTQVSSSVPTEAVSMEQKPVEAEKPVKKGRKGLVIGLVVVAVLLIGGLVVWVMLSNRGEENDKVADNSEIEQPKEETKPGDENSSTTVEVDLDSLEFHSAFDGFASYVVLGWLKGGYWFSQGVPDKITANDITDDIALSWATGAAERYNCSAWAYELRPIALRQVDGFLESSITDSDKAREEQIRKQLENEINNEGWLRYSTCYSDLAVRVRAWEMFDRDIKLEDGDMIVSGIYGSQHMYTSDLGLFYPWPFFGGGNGFPDMIPYEARRDNDRMYVKTASIICGLSGREEDCNAGYVNNHADEVEARYTWTLKKASDGRYVFESVERME